MFCKILPDFVNFPDCCPRNMAFDLAAALKNRKAQLNTVTTKVTLVDGSEVEEKRSENGAFEVVDDEGESSQPFPYRFRSQHL